MELISVVLVTYNRAHVLGKTIDSILNQTYSNFELLICDDYSPDHTQSVCLQYEDKDSRIRYFRNSKNLRMPNNLNLGISRSQGRYIANIHDGDIYAYTLLERWKSALDACPNAAFVFNSYCALDVDGNERIVYREPLNNCVTGSELLKNFFFARWRFDSPVWGTVMTRRCAYDTVSLLDERFGFFADVDMWMRLAERYHVAYIDEPLIFLPSYDSLPRQFSVSFFKQQSILEKMFWEARMRHYCRQPILQLAEVSRHIAFVVVSRSWQLALLARRKFLSWYTNTKTS